MSNERTAGQRALSPTDITVYVGGLVAGLALTHALIAVVSDGRMGTPGRLGLAGVALFLAVFLYVRWAAIAQRRYGHYFLHVIAYVAVNASFALHALVLYSSGRAEEIAASWRGPLLAMPLVWAVGLFLHTIGTAVSDGYEHVDV
jgi:hypothetical protein